MNKHAFSPIIDVLRESNKTSIHAFVGECWWCGLHKPMHIHRNLWRWEDAGEKCEGYFCDDKECQRRKRLLP